MKFSDSILLKIFSCRFIIINREAKVYDYQNEVKLLMLKILTAISS